MKDSLVVTPIGIGIIIDNDNNTKLVSFGDEKRWFHNSQIKLLVDFEGDVEIADKIMFLWLVERTDNVGYDEHDAVIIAAYTESNSRYIANLSNAPLAIQANDKTHTNLAMYGSPNSYRVTLIGKASSDLVEGVVLDSYCAG